MESTGPAPQYRDESAAALRKAVCEAADLDDSEANAEVALDRLRDSDPGRLRHLLEQHGTFTDKAVLQVGMRDAAIYRAPLSGHGCVCCGQQAQGGQIRDQAPTRLYSAM